MITEIKNFFTRKTGENPKLTSEQEKKLKADRVKNFSQLCYDPTEIFPTYKELGEGTDPITGLGGSILENLENIRQKNQDPFIEAYRKAQVIYLESCLKLDQQDAFLIEDLQEYQNPEITNLLREQKRSLELKKLEQQRNLKWMGINTAHNFHRFQEYTKHLIAKIEENEREELELEEMIAQANQPNSSLEMKSKVKVITNRLIREYSKLNPKDLVEKLGYKEGGTIKFCQECQKSGKLVFPINLETGSYLLANSNYNSLVYPETSVSIKGSEKFVDLSNAQSITMPHPEAKGKQMLIVGIDAEELQKIISENLFLARVLTRLLRVANLAGQEQEFDTLLFSVFGEYLEPESLSYGFSNIGYSANEGFYYTAYAVLRNVFEYKNYEKRDKITRGTLLKASLFNEWGEIQARLALSKFSGLHPETSDKMIGTREFQALTYAISNFIMKYDISNFSGYVDTNSSIDQKNFLASEINKLYQEGLNTYSNYPSLKDRPELIEYLEILQTYSANMFQALGSQDLVKTPERTFAIDLMSSDPLLVNSNVGLQENLGNVNIQTPSSYIPNQESFTDLAVAGDFNSGIPVFTNPEDTTKRDRFA